MGSLSPINSYAFPLKARDYAATPVPSLEDWQTMWKAWDLVTTQMIPAEALMEQPIELRNPLKFYVGHIPTLSVKCSAILPSPGFPRIHPLG